MYNVILQTPEGKTIPIVHTPIDFSAWVQNRLRAFTSACFPYKNNEANDEIRLANVIEHIEDFLMSNLHGSGWDGEWKVYPAANNNFVAYMQYHCMDEWGGYDGWIDIEVRFTNTLEVYRVSFPGASSTTRRKYLWDRDYYEECIYQALRGLQSQIIEDCLLQQANWR